MVRGNGQDETALQESQEPEVLNQILHHKYRVDMLHRYVYNLGHDVYTHELGVYIN